MALNLIVREKARSAFEQRCFRLISEAYQASLTEKIILLDWDENDISSEVHKHIDANPLRLKWRVVSQVEAHLPADIAKEKGFAAKFPRIDFKLTAISQSGEYKYFFEAKNLKQNDSALKRRYIDTGIDNFVMGKYTQGSLVGYLLEGSTADTIAGINSLLKKDKRHSEALKAKSDRLAYALYTSSHSSIGILKHLIFDFTSFSS